VANKALLVRPSFASYILGSVAGDRKSGVPSPTSPNPFPLAIIFATKIGLFINVRHYFSLILLGTILYSCSEVESLTYSDLIGEYENGTDSTNYNYLNLRRDSTYLGHQSVAWGDAMIHYHGNWEIKNDILILYNGTDITENLNIIKMDNFTSDTLTINIANNILTSLPGVTFSIHSDTGDLKINKDRIEIIKSKYWDFTDPRINGDSYEYAPVTVNLRYKNIYADLQYAFRSREISISINDNNKPISMSDSVLCKYKKKDGILYSFDETYEIERNNLRKSRN